MLFLVFVVLCVKCLLK